MAGLIEAHVVRDRDHLDYRANQNVYRERGKSIGDRGSSKSADDRDRDSSMNADMKVPYPAQCA